MKDTLIIFGMCLAAIAVGATLFFWAPKNTAVAPAPEEAKPLIEENIAFVVLETGQDSQTLERKNYAARDQESFERVWKIAHGEDGAVMPSIDFSTRYVIGVFAGEKTSGGHAIAVTDIIDHGDVRTVRTRLQEPGEGCINSQALTSPYQLITVPVSTHGLASEDATTVTPC